MIDLLIDEYRIIAELAASIDYEDNDSVQRYNTASDRMRSIVADVVALGQIAVVQFSSILDKQHASIWAAHHLVEMADLDHTTLSKCYGIVEGAKMQAEARGDMATAMGEDLWLKEWRRRNRCQ